MKTAWLVKVDYKVPAMRGFSSYESALKYYHEMVDKIEEQIEEHECEKVISYSSNKPLLTQFIYWNEDYAFRNTLGSVSIKEIEWEDKLQC